MKKLTIVRHAKSDWGDASLADIDRTLNERGQRDAPVMAKRLKNRGFAPDLIVSSPAVRARTTAGIFAEALGYDSDKIEIQSAIYEADLDALVEVVRGLNDDFDSVALFGHNPGVSYCSDWLTREGGEDVPTCCVMEIELKVDSWGKVTKGCGSFTNYDYPKKPALGGS